ncbi:MAG: DUF3592 domain-containing protein [Verrucomicrobia bacterium]|nr:DUF3592 domain-containing protein [Verrucomicrobiota bacterium]
MRENLRLIGLTLVVAGLVLAWVAHGRGEAWKLLESKGAEVRGDLLNARVHTRIGKRSGTTYWLQVRYLPENAVQPITREFSVRESYFNTVTTDERVLETTVPVVHSPDAPKNAIIRGGSIPEGGAASVKFMLVISGIGLFLWLLMRIGAPRKVRPPPLPPSPVASVPKAAASASPAALVAKFNHQKDLRASVRGAVIMTHCMKCSEVVSNLSYSNLRSNMEGYDDCGIQHAYCPNCDLFLEGWFRSKGDAEPELTALAWKKSPTTGKWETQDKFFGATMDATSGERVEQWVNGDFMSHAGLIKVAQFYRQYSGPRYVRDEDRCSVGIPLTGRTEEQARALVSLIEKVVKNKKRGELTGIECRDGIVWGHFNDANALYHTSEMWRRSELPSDASFWCYNEGRPYHHPVWDHGTQAPAVHASVSGVPAAPETPWQAVVPLQKNASLAEAAAWLDARLVEIDDRQPEMDDTLNREELFVVLGNFIHGQEPDEEWNFCLDDEEAERRLQRALKVFLKRAGVAAKEQQLTPEQRKQALIENSRYIADLLD